MYYIFVECLIKWGIWLVDRWKYGGLVFGVWIKILFYKICEWEMFRFIVKWVIVVIVKWYYECELINYIKNMILLKCF